MQRGEQVFILLAIDPSTIKTGWAIFSKDRLAAGVAPQDMRDFDHPATGSIPAELVQAHPEWQLVETGVITGEHRPWRAQLSDRVKEIQSALDSLAERWRPCEAACGKPSIMHLPNQREGVEMLSRTMDQWAQERNLPLYCYPLREIRSVVLGRANAASEELAYTAMVRWGLLGQEKTTHEWNAIAVGDYHLVRQKSVRGAER